MITTQLCDNGEHTECRGEALVSGRGPRDPDRIEWVTVTCECHCHHKVEPDAFRLYCEARSEHLETIEWARRKAALGTATPAETALVAIDEAMHSFTLESGGS